MSIVMTTVNQHSDSIIERTTMRLDEIHYLAHMLDESSHASYYEVYMQEHPEDKLPKLVDSLLEEFAEDLKKDHIDLSDGLISGYATTDSMLAIAEKLKHKYYWERIKA